MNETTPRGDGRRTIDLRDALTGQAGQPDIPAESRPALPPDTVMAVLEQLSPGIARIMTDTLEEDPELLEQLRRGETDLITLYRQLENTDRPAVAPTARAANMPAYQPFNAYALSDEAFARLQQLAHSGNHIRI